MRTPPQPQAIESEGHRFWAQASQPPSSADGPITPPASSSSVGTSNWSRQRSLSSTVTGKVWCGAGSQRCLTRSISVFRPTGTYQIWPLTPCSRASQRTEDARPGPQNSKSSTESGPTARSRKATEISRPSERPACHPPARRRRGGSATQRKPVARPGVRSAAVLLRSSCLRPEGRPSETHVTITAPSRRPSPNPREDLDHD